MLRNLPAAKTVNVEPVDADDWEIVVRITIHHLSGLPEYVLLGAARGVCGAKFTFSITSCVAGSNYLRLGRQGKNACPLSRQSVAETALHMSCSSDRFADSVDPADDVAVRLTIDSEVIIAPKTRYSAASAATKERHNIGSSAPKSASQPVVSPEVEQARRQLLRALPCDVRIPALWENCNSQEDQYIAWVRPKLFQLLIQSFPTTKVCLRIKSCPAIVSKRTSVVPSNGEATISGVVSPDSKVKSPVGPQKLSLDREEPAAEVHLRGDMAVPKGCICLSSLVREALKGNVDGYDLVRISAPSPHVLVNGHNHSSAVAQAAEISPSSSGVLPLPGMEKHLIRCVNHLKCTLMGTCGLTPSSISQPTSGLILCGASGSGKSSLSRRIIDHVRTDPNTLSHTQYIKCVTMVNLRIPQLQSKLDEVFTTSAWHAPSTIVFDDLDSLIPAEVEHIDSFRAQHIASLFLNTARKAINERPIVVMATAKGPEALHSSLSHSHFFGERVFLSSPDKHARREVSMSVRSSQVLGLNTAAS